MGGRISKNSKRSAERFDPIYAKLTVLERYPEERTGSNGLG
jgi:hypothetical protein